MSNVENKCLTPVNVYATVYDMLNNTVIKVIPGRFPQGGFVAALIMGGAIVVDCWGRTKGEAKAEVRRAAREMGVRS